jgi:uncharacterized membrane protein (DUF485 family)
MTSNQVLQRNAATRRQRSYRQLKQLCASTQEHAHRAEDYQREGYDAAGRLQELEDNNPSFRDINMAKVVAYVGITLLLVCAYLFDIVLFYPTAMFVAEETFGSNRPLVIATSLLIPALVLTAEISVASHRHLAREEQRRGAYWGSTLIALVMLVVMPTMVISTHPYMRTLDAESIEGNMLRWQIMAFVALVIVTHGLILFGGHAGHQAKAYSAFAYRLWKLRRAVRRDQSGYATQARAAATDFTNYRRILDFLNSDATERVAPGAFDEITRRVLREHFGYEVIINSTDATPHNIGQTPPANNNGGQPVGSTQSGGSNNGTRTHRGGDDAPPAPPNGTGHGPRPQQRPPFTMPHAQPFTSPPQSPTAPHAQEGNGRDEAGNMEDYYRRILSHRQQDEESEVRT